MAAGWILRQFLPTLLIENFAMGDEYFDCPHCGEPVNTRATMCRGCGADAECGWAQSDINDSGIPDDDFDYDAYLSREFPNEATTVSSANWIKLVMALLILSLLLTML